MENDKLKLEKKHLIKTLVLANLCVPLILIISGDFYWKAGWIFAIWLFLYSSLVPIYLYFKNQELFYERFLRKGASNHRTWDAIFILTFIFLFFIWLIVLGLDRRFHWSMEFPFYLMVLSLFFLTFSVFFSFKSVADNTFASSVVRMQEDRKQHVVSTGVYSFVRHPMYLGGVFAYMGAPLLVNSIYGLAMGILFTIMFSLRILGEERMLETELEGYKEYEQKVKYRLFPFIW